MLTNDAMLSRVNERMNVVRVVEPNGDAETLEEPAFGVNVPSVKVSVGAVFASAMIASVQVFSSRQANYRAKVWCRGVLASVQLDGWVHVHDDEDPTDAVARALVGHICRAHADSIAKVEHWTPVA